MTLAHPKPSPKVKERKSLRRSGPVRKRAKRVPKVKKTSRGKMGRLADKLFSLIVRHSGLCDAGYRSHAGAVQCAHLVSRSYRSVRWDEANALPLCAGCHVYYTHHPLEWEQYITERNGPEAIAALKARAMKRWDGDIEGVLVRLAARAVALGIKP